MTASPYEPIYSKQPQIKHPEVSERKDSLLSKCCCCIPLETGCFILGYTTLILNFIISLFFFGCLAFLAIYTHGFQYLRTKTTEDGERVPDMESLNSVRLTQILIITVFNGCLNLAWFTMCIVLLVSLHKKQPRHIKSHVSIAIVRLILSIVGVALYVGHTVNSQIFCNAEIVLTAFFIYLYYRYANQLVREQQSEDPKAPKPLSKTISNVISIYPQNIDTVTLAEKKEKPCPA